MLAVVLSSPGPPAQHSTPHRVVTFFLCQLLNLTGGCQNSPCRAGRCTCPRLSITFRLRGGCLAFVPKSPVHTGTTDFGGYPFVSRPSRSTFHPAARCHVFLCQLLNLTGGSQNSPRRGGPLRPPARVHVVLANIACVVDASRSCRSRRYSLTPLMLVVALSSPGPPVQHSTALRVVTFDRDECWINVYAG